MNFPPDLAVDTSINESTRLTTGDPLTKEAASNNDSSRFHPLEQESPGPRTLHRCSFTQCAMFVIRVTRMTGSGMFGASIASGLCSHMMNETTVHPNQPIFLGVGSFMYIASLVPALAMTREGARAFLTQAGQDIVVPALTAFSLYFIQAHNGI